MTWATSTARRNLLVPDAVLAAVLLLAGLPTPISSQPPTRSVTGLLVYVAVCLPVLFRRTRPVVATVIAAVAGLAQLAVGVTPSLSDLALVIVVYSAVAYGPRWLTTVTAAVRIARISASIDRPCSAARRRSFSFTESSRSRMLRAAIAPFPRSTGVLAMLADQLAGSATTSLSLQR